jgi:hypothetical protein
VFEIDSACEQNNNFKCYMSSWAVTFSLCITALAFLQLVLFFTCLAKFIFVVTEMQKSARVKESALLQHFLMFHGASDERVSVTFYLMCYVTFSTLPF